VDAGRSGQLFLIDDMRTEERWPDYSRHAVERAVGSSLSVPLPFQATRIGALNNYSTQPHAFGADEVTLVQEVAAWVAFAVANATAGASAADEVADMQAAVITRGVIEQAKGILMEHHKVTADQTFYLLTASSQHTGLKLRDVAAELVRTGVLPGSRRADSPSSIELRAASAEALPCRAGTLVGDDENEERGGRGLSGRRRARKAPLPRGWLRCHEHEELGARHGDVGPHRALPVNVAYRNGRTHAWGPLMSHGARFKQRNRLEGCTCWSSPNRGLRAGRAKTPSVEVAGIEPASLDSEPGLLRAQLASRLLGSCTRASTSQTSPVSEKSRTHPETRCGQQVS